MLNKIMSISKIISYKNAWKVLIKRRLKKNKKINKQEQFFSISTKPITIFNTAWKVSKYGKVSKDLKIR